MSKSKKEPYVDGNDSSFLRRTIVNAPSSSSRKSEDNDRRSQTSHSRSTDSSPEPKKYRKPVARGSETGIIFDKKKLKKYSVTIKNKLVPVKAPILHIHNPETITPVRRPEYSDESDDYDHVEKYRSKQKRKNEANLNKYEGKQPIFEKKERPLSPDDRKSSSHDVRLESSRRKYRSRSREESPEYRIQRSRSNHSGSRSRKHRRARSPSSRRSSSSESSSSSSDERSKRRKYCSSRANKEREQKQKMRRVLKMERDMLEKEMQRRERRLHEERERERDRDRERERRQQDDRDLQYRKKRHEELIRHFKSNVSSYSNGSNPQNRLKERPKEIPPETVSRSSQELVEIPRVETPSHEMMRPRFPVRMMPPPYMMRVPMRPFAPPPAPFAPAYPPPVRFYPRPPLPFRPMLRPPRPPRGFFRPP